MFEDMLSPDAMSGTETRKYGCPLFYINYLVSPRKDCIGDNVSELLFEDFDNRTFIKTEAASLVESAAELNMVRAKTSSTEAHLPEPVSLQETLSQKSGDDYYKWGVEKQTFPAQLLEQIWEKNVAFARNHILAINRLCGEEDKIRTVSLSSRGEQPAW